VAWEKPALRSGGLPARGSKPLPAIMKSGQPRPQGQNDTDDGEPGQSQGDYVSWLVALVGIAVKFLIFAAFHFVRPDVNPVVEPISNYGVGPYGFLLIVADIGSVVATLALVFGLYLGMVRSYVGLFLLGLTGVSELLAGIFPIDVGAEVTTAGTIHNIAGNISFFCFPIAAILLSLRMGKVEQWRSLRRPALALSIVVVLTVILTIAGANLGIGYGVAQRIANVAVMVWMFVVALHLRSVAQRALAQQPLRVS
jgi:hypothetical membrane protein